ncbi:phage holin [Mycoplasmopsis pulmonis]|uniref:phage holin n=1 Tax=Mycoplasmopsis pulmonis TaxID=2107 RepID=UPI002ACD888C|nr:phage holin [Mycoplasmopsis pulmonis]MDZ7293767.1 phage holin [Mycoplasmopsis pulmonis]
MNETLKIVISSISIGLTLISVIIALIIKFSKNKKIKDNAEKAAKIFNVVYQYVKDAEKLVNTPGIEKKKSVERLVEEEVEDLGIEYDKEQVSNLIETAVAKLKKEKTDEIS